MGREKCCEKCLALPQVIASFQPKEALVSVRHKCSPLPGPRKRENYGAACGEPLGLFVLKNTPWSSILSSVPRICLSLTDILREFNGNLIGYAVGTGDVNSTNAFLNQAVPGAKAEYDIWGAAKRGTEACSQSLRDPYRGLQGALHPSATMILRALFLVPHSHNQS